MSSLDKAYGQGSFLATEQDMQRSRGSPSRLSRAPSGRGSPGLGGPDRCWTRVRTIIEQRKARLRLSEYQEQHDNCATLETDYNQEEKNIRTPIVAMEEDEEVDIKTVQKIKDRFKGENLYCQENRRRGRKDKLSAWREQMKTLEDYPGMTKMYDRVGKEAKTLLQERDAARKQTNVVNKRGYAVLQSKAGHRIEYSQIRIDKAGEKKHYTTLDVAKAPQALKKRVFGDMVYTDATRTSKLKGTIIRGRAKATKLSK